MNDYIIFHYEGKMGEENKIGPLDDKQNSFTSGLGGAEVANQNNINL